MKTNNTDLFGRFQLWKQVDSTLRDFVSITQAAFPRSFWRGIKISINLAGTGLFIFPAAMVCDAVPAGTASQYLSTLFDKQITNTRFNAIVDEIVKEWELRTKSSFTPWMTEKTLGTLVCLYIFIFRAFYYYLAS